MEKPAKKRFKPYAWVTWLASLLAEEKLCKYAVWLPTQYQIEKPSSNYDPSEHDEMVIQRASQLQAEGFTVYVEYANSLKVNGKIFDICVAGRPDIVAIKDSWVVVEDCKTGKRRDSHRFQVLLYMLLLPLAPETKHYCQGHTPHGRLVYPDGIVEIPAWNVDRQFKQLLRQIIATICSTTPPNPTPSPWECRYCNIPDAYCSAKSDRILIDIPNRRINVELSAEELANRRAGMEAKGKDAWKPAQPRSRRVSAALKAYALLVTSADQGAVRNLEMLE